MRNTVSPSALMPLSRFRRSLLWVGAALFGIALGVALIVQQALQRGQADFETGARIAHRLLSQRAVQHEAVLATLSLMQPMQSPQSLRLAAVYPQILQLQRRAGDQAWSGPASLRQALTAAEAGGDGPRLAFADLHAGRFWIVSSAYSRINASGAAYAIEVSLPLMVPWTEWPFGSERGKASAHAWLEHGGARWTLHEARAGDDDSMTLRRFVFRKHLASESQPFDLVVERRYRLADLPWAMMAAWAIAWTGLLAGLAQVLRQRRARERAEELLRLGQISRLNALGELAAGLAHELNQPLTAIVANTQAAARMLADEPPELETAHKAMTQTVVQARRAADVVTRLRRLIERPNAGQTKAIDLAAAARNMLHLVEPECARRGVTAQLIAGPAALVMADPVALDQVMHNLVSNALHALEAVPDPRLMLLIDRDAAAGTVRLTVRDNGPGVAPQLVTRLFEPFVSGRANGLGLGLSLCETLTEEMGGSLRYRPAPSGAEFILDLPAANVDAEWKERSPI